MHYPSMPWPHLLLHLLNLADGAATLRSVLMSEEVDVDFPRLTELLLLLFLCLLQLALSTDAFRVVHVICLHHLKAYRHVVYDSARISGRNS